MIDSTYSTSSKTEDDDVLTLDKLSELVAKIGVKKDLDRIILVDGKLYAMKTPISEFKIVEPSLNLGYSKHYWMPYMIVPPSFSGIINYDDSYDKIRLLLAPESFWRLRTKIRDFLRVYLIIGRLREISDGT